MPRALNREQSATLSNSCLVSSVESKESEVSKVEGDLETVEPYQFEPVASDSSVELDYRGRR